MRTNHLEEANKVFLKGAKGGMRATDWLYDLMIEEDCKAGDHSNALEISYEMEAAGRFATTFHFNCLLSVQVCYGVLGMYVTHASSLSNDVKFCVGYLWDSRGGLCYI